MSETDRKEDSFLVSRRKLKFKDSDKRTYRFFIILFLILITAIATVHLLLLKKFRKVIIFPGG